jgi:hypothetical protein
MRPPRPAVVTIHTRQSMVIKRFVFEPNGEEVFKQTDSEVTGYIPPRRYPWKCKLWYLRLGGRVGRLRYHERRRKRRRLKPVRGVHAPQRTRKKRYHGPLRYWSRVPRR